MLSLDFAKHQAMCPFASSMGKPKLKFVVSPWTPESAGFVSMFTRPPPKLAGATIRHAQRELATGWGGWVVWISVWYIELWECLCHLGDPQVRHPQQRAGGLLDRMCDTASRTPFVLPASPICHAPSLFLSPKHAAQHSGL